MLYDPSREIYDIVRRLARTGRLFNIHLRNIKGNRNEFLEVFPGGRQAYAHGFGYLKALMQATELSFNIH